MVAFPQQSGEMLLRRLDRIDGHGGAHDVFERSRAPELGHRRRVRQNDEVVLILAGRRLPFRLEHTEHCEAQGIEAHVFADRVLLAEFRDISAGCQPGSLRRVAGRDSTQSASKPPHIPSRRAPWSMESVDSHQPLGCFQQPLIEKAFRHP
jgi:hypothetical protein